MKFILFVLLVLSALNVKSQNPEQWIFTATSYRVDNYDSSVNDYKGMGWTEIDKQLPTFSFSEKEVIYNNKSYKVLERKMKEETIEQTIYTYWTYEENTANLFVIDIRLVEKLKPVCLVIVYDKHNEAGVHQRLTSYVCTMKRKPDY